MDKPINLLIYVDDNIKREIIEEQMFNEKHKPNKELIKINVGTIGHIDYDTYSTSFTSNRPIYYGYEMYRKKYPFQRYYMDSARINSSVQENVCDKYMEIVNKIMKDKDKFTKEKLDLDIFSNEKDFIKTMKTLEAVRLKELGKELFGKLGSEY